MSQSHQFPFLLERLKLILQRLDLGSQILVANIWFRISNASLSAVRSVYVGVGTNQLLQQHSAADSAPTAASDDVKE